MKSLFCLNVFRQTPTLLVLLLFDVVRTSSLRWDKSSVRSSWMVSMIRETSPGCLGPTMNFSRLAYGEMIPNSDFGNSMGQYGTIIYKCWLKPGALALIALRSHVFENMLCHSTWITFYHALRDESFLITWMAQVQVVRFQKIGIPSSKPTMAAMRIRGSFLGKNDYKWRTNTMSSLLPEGITLRSGNVMECWNLHQGYSTPYKSPTSASHIWSSTSFALAASRSRSLSDTWCRSYLRLLQLGFLHWNHGLDPVWKRRNHGASGFSMAFYMLPVSVALGFFQPWTWPQLIAGTGLS